MRSLSVAAVVLGDNLARDGIGLWLTGRVGHHNAGEHHGLDTLEMLVHGSGDLAVAEAVIDHDMARLFSIQLLRGRVHEPSLLPLLTVATCGGLNLAGEHQCRETANWIVIVLIHGHSPLV
jgi:hypothetical protein